MLYNVAYDAPGGVQYYQTKWSDLPTAQNSLALFKGRYLNDDGTGKPYPNGKGFYPFRNPRVVSGRVRHG